MNSRTMSAKSWLGKVVAGMTAVIFLLGGCSTSSHEKQESASPVSSDSSLSKVVYAQAVTSTDGVPYDAAAWFEAELALFDYPFPSAVYVPKSILDFEPGIKNSTAIDSSATASDGQETLALDKDNGTASPSQYVVVQGDIFTNLTARWYCAWTDEYLQGVGESDAVREERALENLAILPSDPQMIKYAESLASLNSDIYVPLTEGDLKPAEQFVKACEIWK